MKKHALYPGSFDPLTNGHINIVRRALEIFETVTVAIAQNSRKPKVFSINERQQMIEEVFEDEGRVFVEAFNGLLVDYVASKEDATVIRGIRTNEDFEYELSLAQANKHLKEDFETVFMMTSPQYSFLSSSMIQEIISLGGHTNGMLPEFIEKRLKQRLEEARNEF